MGCGCCDPYEESLTHPVETSQQLTKMLHHEDVGSKGAFTLVWRVKGTPSHVVEVKYKGGVAERSRLPVKLNAMPRHVCADPSLMNHLHSDLSTFSSTPYFVYTTE